MCEEGVKEKKSFWDREITIFGITLSLKEWMVVWFFLALGIYFYLRAILYSGPEEDILNTSLGSLSILISVIAVLLTVSRRQADTILRELREMRSEVRSELQGLRSEMREGFRQVVQGLTELRDEVSGLRRVLEELVQELRRRSTGSS